MADAANGSKAGSTIRQKSPRNKGKSAERWNQVLTVATRLFRERGFAATSMQDVGDAVGLLKGSLYYYVKSKEDLLVAILHDLHDDGEKFVMDIDFESENPLGELESFLVMIVNFSCENADRLAIFLRDFHFVPEDQQGSIIAERDLYSQATERLIERAKAVGQVPATVHSGTAARMVLRAASSTQEWYRAKGELSVDDVARQTATILVNGLAHFTPVQARRRPGAARRKTIKQ